MKYLDKQIVFISGSAGRQCRDEGEGGGGGESREEGGGLSLSSELSSPASPAEHQTQDGFQ